MATSCLQGEKILYLDLKLNIPAKKGTCTSIFYLFWFLDILIFVTITFITSATATK
uniref:Uncharacterized protein n=1 Tax=Anguilla anguilla TaxID=7936 RepID=A0A0E9Y1C3_ANGAN